MNTTHMQVNLPNVALPDLVGDLRGHLVLADVTGPHPHFGGAFRGCRIATEYGVALISVGLDDYDGYGQTQRAAAFPIEAHTGFYLPEPLATKMLDLALRHLKAEDAEQRWTLTDLGQAAIGVAS